MQFIWKRELLLWSFIVATIATTLMVIDIRHGFLADPLLKAIQSHSLQLSGYQSEELYYPAAQLDPEFEYYLFQPPFLVSNGGRYLGQYPLLYSILLAPLSDLALIPYLSLLTVLFFLATLAILRYQWHFSIALLMIALFATYYLPLSIDVSENSLLILLNGVALTLILKYFPTQAWWPLVVAGIASGISVWLRLEAIPYMAVLLAALLGVYGVRSRERLLRVGLIGVVFSLPVILFIVFNYSGYGHPLGPRYGENYHTHASPILEQLRIMSVLIVGGSFKLGFFGYIPLFLMVATYYAAPSRFQALPPHLKVSLLSGVGFLFAAALLAPNDGMANAGPRYLALAIFPFLLLTHHYWSELRSAGFANRRAKLLRIAGRAAITYSVVITLFVIAVYSVATKQLQAYQEQFRSSNSELWIFGHQSCGFVGLDYFKTPSLCLYDRNEHEPLWQRISQQHAGEHITYFYRSEFAKSSHQLTIEESLERHFRIESRVEGDFLSSIRYKVAKQE